MHRPLWHRWLRPMVLAVALLALGAVGAGCIRVEVAIRVNDDGSGTVTVLAAFDRDLMELAGDDFDLSELTEIDESELPPGASVEPYEEGDFVGVRVTAPFESGDDVAASIDRLFAGTGGESEGLSGEDGLFQRFVLEREGDRWRFEADIEIDADDLTGGTDSEQVGGALAQFLFQDASFVVRLALPGEVMEHNADEVGSDGELVWNIDIFGGEPRTLSATSELNGGGGGGGATIAVAAAALLIAGLVAAGVILARRARAAAS